MSTLPYIISKNAISDIEDIWRYTVKKWSADQANRYYQLIFDEINFICSKPESGKQIDHIRAGYRMSKVKSHLLFYRVVNNTVEVVRILHERMDIEAKLANK